jgi:hypothetical protein
MATVAGTLIKAVAKQALGCRTMLLAALAGIAGALVCAGLGAWLWRRALWDVRGEGWIWSIDLPAVIVYGLAGAIMGFASVLLGAAARAVGELRPVVRPAVERCAIVAVDRLPTIDQRVEIARVEQLCGQACDAVIVEQPVLRPLSKLASALVRRRIQKHLDPFIAPLRESGETHVDMQLLHRYATDAGTTTLLDLAAAQITRPRTIAWVAVGVMFLVPLCVWLYRIFL